MGPFGVLSEPQVLKQRARSDENADSWLAQLSLPWPPSLKGGLSRVHPGRLARMACSPTCMAVEKYVNRLVKP